ncbi:hypothetical protein C8A03DRAFT_15611 [Achaetomium macrosporum]|uniref:Zn(2)-C6 fungal-type domain-containing protein n=1 Tax=Achaetomium macrosporum TaxID=79813 RepID=A0AAN7C9J0_9PEZI|nr:hypothetical protein C8A03DRAFT_15611 [Achaetomium macrosporum]
MIDKSNPQDQQPGNTVASSANQQEMELPAKRRKLRKGTRSCWECKRRKIRCMYASPGDATCIGCQHRRVPCVPQEVPEDPFPVKKDSRRLGERIARIEKIMNDLQASKNAVETSPGDVRELRRERPPLASSDGAWHHPYELSFRTPPESLAESTPNSTLHTPGSDHVSRDSQAASDQTDTETARHHLFEALPSPEDVKLLLRESSRPSWYTHLVNTQPHSRLTLETLAAPHPIAELPRPGIHPVSLARLMLTLAITLQSPSGEDVHNLSEPSGVLMRRLVTAARTWVTTQEEMHGSLECLICIILEGIYEMNLGNLRRAWAVFRRAMTVAQLMGLHRSPIPPIPRIEPDLDADPEFMWFRIVYLDRYLSLLLGLPQGTSDKRMGATPALRHEPALGKFERMLTVVASRVLERNESPFATSQISTTQSIDAELLEVSRSMPASFWRAPNFHNLTPGSPDTLLETTRLAAHVYYHGLLIQLHLPYMMRIGDHAAHEYSKVTCVNASREILSRFIAHRSFNPSSSCSRPVDFFALLAAMALLLAYLDAPHHREATNILAHQRLSDRAMLDQALERMDAIRNVDDDVITEKSAQLIRQLLDIEADAAEGSSYTARNVEGEDDMHEGRREAAEVHLNIPYLGVIRIARRGPISHEPLAGNTLRRPSCQTSQAELPQREPPSGEPNDALASVSYAAVPDEQHLDRPSNAQLLQGPWYEQSMLQCANSTYDDNVVMPSHASLPPIAAGADDWAFQGVDLAFFDGLMRGTACPDAAGLEP